MVELKTMTKPEGVLERPIREGSEAGPLLAAALAAALVEYQRALETCAAFGFVRDAIQDLELIRGAGFEGLGPAFEILESAEEVCSV